MNDITKKFTDAMRDVGIIPTAPIIADGTLHRAHVENDRMGTLNLAYVLHLDGNPAGWWQHFRTGITGTWSASGKREPLTPTMLRQIEFARAERAKEQAGRHAKAAEKARWIGQQAQLITDPAQHHYSTIKRIKPHGARLYGTALVISLMDESGAIVNLQFIQPDGTKRFLSGGRKKGCYSTIGKPTETILICEGWTTGVSLYESTGHYVIVAMDAGNLKPVAEIARRQHPDGK
ncbi:MAG: hypothetical protein HOO93_12820, partial [Methyloglobulus sp.]|nr:hypothetical protein [Methyloglobulus sp.]